MNKTLSILLALCGLAVVSTSCDNEDEAATPVASMTINKTDLETNESMLINFNGSADQVVIWTGDEDHDYELRDKNNTGFAVNKGRFSYSYTKPGTYKVVCLASTYTEKALDLKRDTCSFYVKVIDDNVEINQLSCPQVLYDEVYAKKVNDNDWLMQLPRKILFNGRDRNVNLSQRLKFYIKSELTTVTINGEDFSSTKRYDLSSPLDITAKSDFGTTKNYKLYTMYYPEFKTFSIAGVKGTIQRDEFNYNDFIMNVELPVGTDVKSIAPEFTTYSADEKVYIGNTEQVSNSTKIDFTQPVTYRLQSTIENGKLTSESTFKINIVFK